MLFGKVPQFPHLLSGNDNNTYLYGFEISKLVKAFTVLTWIACSQCSVSTGFLNVTLLKTMRPDIFLSGTKHS